MNVGVYFEGKESKGSFDQQEARFGWKKKKKMLESLWWWSEKKGYIAEILGRKELELVLIELVPMPICFLFRDRHI